MTGTKRPLSGEKEVSQCKRARSIRNNIQSSQVIKYYLRISGISKFPSKCS